MQLLLETETQHNIVFPVHQFMSFQIFITISKFLLPTKGTLDVRNILRTRQPSIVSTSSWMYEG